MIELWPTGMRLLRAGLPQPESGLMRGCVFFSEHHLFAVRGKLLRHARDEVQGCHQRVNTDIATTTLLLMPGVMISREGVKCEVLEMDADGNVGLGLDYDDWWW